jgi:hypothetical protein
MWPVFKQLHLQTIILRQRWRLKLFICIENLHTLFSIVWHGPKITYSASSGCGSKFSEKVFFAYFGLWLCILVKLSKDTWVHGADVPASDRHLCRCNRYRSAELCQNHPNQRIRLVIYIFFDFTINCLCVFFAIEFPSSVLKQVLFSDWTGFCIDVFSLIICFSGYWRHSGICFKITGIKPVVLLKDEN